MPFIASLIFIILVYLVPLRPVIMERVELFPFLGRAGSFLPTSVIIYLLILTLLYLVKQFHVLVWPGMTEYLSDKLYRRTGLYEIEIWGLWLSAVAFIIFLVVDPTLVPLTLAAILGFGWLAVQPVMERQVGMERMVRKSPPPRESAPGTPEESARKENLISRRFDWLLERKASEPVAGGLEVMIDRRQYEVFSEKNPWRRGVPAVRNYKQFVSGGQTEEILKIAADLIDISRDQEFSLYDEIANAVSFVQAIPYDPEGESKINSYLSFPVETLYNGSGNDASKAVLLAAILKAAQHDVLILESGGETAVAVAGAEGIPGRFFEHEGRRYFYCRTGAGGARLGQLPSDKARDQFKVYGV